MPVNPGAWFSYSFLSKFQNIYCCPSQSLTYFSIPNLKDTNVCSYHYKFQYLNESVVYQKILWDYLNYACTLTEASDDDSSLIM